MRHPESASLLHRPSLPSDQVHSRSGHRGGLRRRQRGRYSADSTSVSGWRARDDPRSARSRVGARGEERCDCSAAEVSFLWRSAWALLTDLVLLADTRPSLGSPSCRSTPPRRALTEVIRLILIELSSSRVHRHYPVFSYPCAYTRSPAIIVVPPFASWKASRGARAFALAHSPHLITSARL